MDVGFKVPLETSDRRVSKGFRLEGLGCRAF